MNVSINGKPVGEFSGSAERELNRIFRELYEQNEIVQEVIIDGTSYREGYNERIMQNPEAIRELHIQTVNGGVVAAEIAEELKEYLPKVLRACDSISELLYGQMSGEDWGLVRQLLEGIGWVVQSVDILGIQSERAGDGVRTVWWQEFAAAAAEQIAQLERHFAEQEFTAAGDLLKYEMPETFQTLLDRLAGEPS